MLDITTRLVDDIAIGNGFSYIFCDSLSAMGLPNGPFHLENYRVQILPTISWFPTSPTLHPYNIISACGVDKKLSKMAGNSASYLYCGAGNLIDLE